MNDKVKTRERRGKRPSLLHCVEIYSIVIVRNSDVLFNTQRRYLAHIYYPDVLFG